MSLATRCPDCNTLFKVTSGQLQLHEGQVRCGQCQSVFSGIEHLTSADTEAWQKLDLGSKTYAAESGNSNDTQNAEDLFAKAPAPKPWLDFKQAQPAMLAACLALSSTLALQAAWFQRADILEQAPSLAQQINEAGPGLQNLFSSPATQALLVEGSDLQALDEDNLRVDLTLRNQRNLPTAWPHLKIDLLDSQGLVLASKSLSPADYQVRDQGAASQAPLIAGQKTVEVLAYLNLIELNRQMPENAPTGFRLELFDRGAH